MRKIKMILLKKYIKSFLKEAATSAIMKKASDLTGKAQHQSAASYSSDMSEVDNQEALLKVLENVGDNCFISFVDKYDEKIPRLEVSPDVSYDTPHGNYAYPLTIKSLKDIIEKGKIGGASFALDRPYFHMFKKSNSSSAVDIEVDGSNNYRGEYRKDLRTIVHTAIMFKAAKKIEEQESLKSYEEIPLSKRSDTADAAFKKIKNEMISGKDFEKVFNNIISELCILAQCNRNRFPRKALNAIVRFFSIQVHRKANSSSNMFFNRSEDNVKSDFHSLYYACYMLSDIISNNLSEPAFEDNDPNAFDVNKINWYKPKENKVRQGSVFTMLLNSIDIDFINDKGSSTLHASEPIQAVYLNSSKVENVVLIGTFNNIFKTKDINNIYELIPPIGESNKTVTMEKIINILEQNPQLNDLFGTELFDDVKLENSIEDLREKAWKDLINPKSKFFDFILFHSSNKIFNFNMYLERDGSKLIVFDIGIKEKFLNSSIEKQLKIIKSEIPKIVKIEDSLTYIQMFLQKNKNKNIYRIKDLNSHNDVMEIIDKIMDYLANYEGSKDAKNELRTMIRLFIYFTQELAQLTNIATQSYFKG